MDAEPQPVKVSSIGEEYAYLGSLQCEVCGDNYRPVRQSLLLPPDRPPMDQIEVACLRCGHTRVVLFDISEFFRKY
jgi:transcription elongation factor Elf1